MAQAIGQKEEKENKMLGTRLYDTKTYVPHSMLQWGKRKTDNTHRENGVKGGGEGKRGNWKSEYTEEKPLLCVLVIELTQKSDSLEDPVGRVLVCGELNGQHVVGGLA